LTAKDQVAAQSAADAENSALGLSATEVAEILAGMREE
jgi:hypothetical protein